MSRKVARDLVFKLAFELCFVKPQETTTYDDFLQNRLQALQEQNPDETPLD